jgi:hypothetical protein
MTALPLMNDDAQIMMIDDSLFFSQFSVIIIVRHASRTRIQIIRNTESYVAIRGKQILLISTVFVRIKYSAVVGFPFF